MVVFKFSVLDGKHPFLANLVQKMKSVNFSSNLLHRLIYNFNMKNSMVVFTLSVLDQKHSFWKNLVQTLSIVSLNGNLMPRLI